MFSSDDMAVWTCSKVTLCVDCRDEMSDSCSCFSIYILRIAGHLCIC